MKFELPIIGKIEILVCDKHLKEFILRQFSNYVISTDDRKTILDNGQAYIYTDIKFSDVCLFEKGIYSRKFRVNEQGIYYENVMLGNNDGNLYIKVLGRRERAIKLKDVYYKFNQRNKYAKYHAMFYRTILFPIFSLYALMDGFFLIHGSTLSYNGHMFAVTGLDGVGKSTLTTKLCQRGANILSDNFTLYNGREVVPLLMPLRVEADLEVAGFDVLYRDDKMKEIIKYNNQENKIELENVFVLSIAEKFACKDSHIGKLDWVMYMNNAPEICDANRFIGPFLLQPRKLDSLESSVCLTKLMVPKGDLDNVKNYIEDMFAD